MLLCWDDEQVDVKSVDELDAQLAAVTEAHPDPLLVSLVGAAGTLTLGVGHPEGGLAQFAHRDESRPPLHSLGDADAEAGDFSFSRGNAAISFFPRCMISREAMLAAAHEYVTDGATLPSAITWEAEPSGPW